MSYDDFLNKRLAIRSLKDSGVPRNSKQGGAVGI